MSQWKILETEEDLELEKLSSRARRKERSRVFLSHGVSSAQKAEDMRLELERYTMSPGAAQRQQGKSQGEETGMPSIS